MLRSRKPSCIYENLKKIFIILIVGECLLSMAVVNDRNIQRMASADKVSSPVSKVINVGQIDDWVETDEITEEIETNQGPKGLRGNNETNATSDSGLNCDRYGGPPEEIAADMVYWKDIPEDSSFVSPYLNYGPESKYLTFQPVEAGWNNVRMSMETALALAVAMGRTLVLPPARPMKFLLEDDDKKKNSFTFNDFFDFDSLAQEHPAVDIISMEEFLEREGMAGHLKDEQGVVIFPPGNKTSLENDGVEKGNNSKQQSYKEHEKELWEYVQVISASPFWHFEQCITVIPKVPGPDAASQVKAYQKKIKDHFWDDLKYKGKPTAVDASPLDRMKEMLGNRKKICVYDEYWQNKPILHFTGESTGARLLTHFYSFVFFEDWRQDLWTKRFVRDHIRYLDQIQCAAARIVNAVREKAKEHGDEQGHFESFHIRRGDFQDYYPESVVDAVQIYKNVQDVFVEGSTVFVATDERDKSFFDPLRAHYHLYFLDDFSDLITGVNKNFYGMLDQLVASRGRAFAGSYLSTFTGYINRMRGYHSQKSMLPGYEKGSLQSYFYAPLANKYDMREFQCISWLTWGSEFPVSWRDIDRYVATE